MPATSSEAKVCVLTGASGTIGYAIAQALKSSDTSWHIIIIGRREPPPSVTHVGGIPPSTIPYDTFLKVDMTNETAVNTTLNSHFESMQDQSMNKLDLLINCAGCSLGNAPIADVSADTFRAVMEINLVVPFILSKWAMTKMATPAGGRIINIGSVANESPRLHALPYTTSKYALTGLTRCLSVEGRFLAQTTKQSSSLGDAGELGVVAVCQVSPGNVRSSIMSPEEAARREKEEGFVEAEDVGTFVATIANLPNSANCLDSMIMPTRMPLVSRG